MEIAGPGFLNITLHDAAVLKHLEGCRAGESLLPDVGAGKTVVLDYSSPNVAKPMHIGHIRSSVIGNALYRIFTRLGYKAIGDNHLGDWGTQFGLLLLGYKHFVDEEKLAASPVEELERIYVASYNKSKEDDAWLQEARETLVQLQQGNEEYRSLWSRFVELSLQEFQKIYERLDIRFDLVRGESFYNDHLAALLDELKAASLLEESEGAQVVNLEAEKLGVCIVQKSDGGFNYATTDLATVKSRVEEFKPDEIIYVTDERQQLHFKQFFKVVEKLGWNVNLSHVWFGLMRLPDATFSTREGNVIKLEALLDEAVSRAFDIVKQSSPGMPEEMQREVAEVVGIAAIKYADLSQNPQSLVTFTWDKAMALDGNSAPYLQYSYARIQSVLDKYKEQFAGKALVDYELSLGEDVEREIAIKLLQYPEAVLAAAKHYKPNLIADYLFTLAQLYSRFYQTIPFLKAEEGKRESRLALGTLVGETIKDGLDLLGIRCAERI